MRRKAKNIPCRYKVVAAGLDKNGNIIDITGNSHRLEARSWHAEEVLIFRNPPNIRRILIGRFNKSGKCLAILPCSHCSKIAANRGIVIEAI
jgi:hypothetical protein